MQIQNEQLENDIFKITLAGRMDIAGAQEIDLKFTGMTSAPHKYFIIDLAGVEFLASIGIRTLLINAKTLSQRNGKMVILNPDANIEKILVMAGIDVLIPIFNNFEFAMASFSEVDQA